MTRLFLYGTLLDPRLLARFAGRALPAAPAKLPGWRRVRLRGTAYPTLRRLRCSEGPRYRLVPVRARCRGRPVRARAWIAAAATPRAWP